MYITIFEAQGDVNGVPVEYLFGKLTGAPA